MESGKNKESTEDASTKKSGNTTQNKQQKKGKYPAGKFSQQQRNMPAYYDDQQRYECQFCTFKCRRVDEMSCHYREKHDYVVSRGDQNGPGGYGNNISPVCKTSAPTRHSLIFSPSNYIFISNPGEYLLDINNEQIEGVLSYIPSFLFRHDADDYLYAFKKNLPWQQIEAFNKKVKKTLKEPRLSCYFGPDYEYGPVKWQDKKEFEPKMAELKAIVEKHCKMEFNSALGILYRTGRDHMGWHSDDEPELGKHPIIASISLGATRYFEFSQKGGVTKLIRLALKHGDLLVTKGCIQEKWKHWVPRDPDVQHCRINITFRNVDPSKRVPKGTSDGKNAVAASNNKASGDASK